MASKLLLKRREIRGTVYAGYVGLILIFIRSFLDVFNIDLDIISVTLGQLIETLGLFLVLFMLLGVYTSINIPVKSDEIKKPAIN